MNGKKKGNFGDGDPVIKKNDISIYYNTGAEWAPKGTSFHRISEFIY